MQSERRMTNTSGQGGVIPTARKKRASAPAESKMIYGCSVVGALVLEEVFCDMDGGSAGEDHVS
jgi:hypothetical protein